MLKDREKLETNEEFVVRLMNFGCPTGPMIQPFILEALRSYSNAVCSTNDAESFDKNSPVPYVVWKATAEWLKSELDKKYASLEKSCSGK